MHVRRPRLDYESHAVGLDRNEVGVLAETGPDANRPNHCDSPAVGSVRSVRSGSGLLEAGRPAAGGRPVDQEGDDRPDDGAEDPGSLNTAVIEVLPEQQVAQEAADEAADDAEDQGRPDAHRVRPRNEEPGEKAGHEADDEQVRIKPIMSSPLLDDGAPGAAVRDGVTPMEPPQLLQKISEKTRPMAPTIIKITPMVCRFTPSASTSTA